MKGKEKIKRYSVEEVALLGIFVISLLIGRFVVIQHHKIQLSSPIEMEYSGLSVSLPASPGWQHTQTWYFNQKNNCFVLTSRLNVRNQVAAIVQWRYMLAPKKAAVLNQLSERVSNAGAVITNTGQTSFNNILMEWAQAQLSGGTNDIFLGIAILKHENSIELEVMAPGDPDLAWQVFQKVSGSLLYQANSLLETGDIFVDQLKKTGLRDLIETDTGKNKERAFLIIDNDDNVIGFSLGFYEDIRNLTHQVDTKVNEFFYIDPSNGSITEYNTFECNNHLDEFTWQSRYLLADNQESLVTKVRLTKDGAIQVTTEALDEDKTYWPRRGSIPNVLLDLAFVSFLDSSNNEMMIDVIYPNGMIVPTLVSKKETSNEDSDGEIAYTIRLDFPHGKERYQEIYFDSDKQIVRKLDQKQTFLIWQRSDRKTLLEKFGSKHKHIEQMLRWN